MVEKQFTKLDKVRGKMGNQLIKALTPQLTKALAIAQNQGEADAEKVRKQCQKQMKSLLGGELKRMQSLQKVNPSIRDEEIAHLQQQIDDLKLVISEARVNLEAIRLIVNNP